MMTVITGSGTKPTKDAKAGIAFVQATSKAPLIIKLIREDSLFSHTELKPGLLVLSVCGIDIAGQTAKDAADVLRAAEGEDTVVAATVKRGVVATAVKGIAEDTVGVSIQKDAKLGIICISEITDGGLFDKTGLAKGQVVVAINGSPCPATTKEAIIIIKETVGKLSIVTEDVEEAVEWCPVPQGKKGDQVAVGGVLAIASL
jgi:C-terminal processing protease CtpA/Prc